MKRILALISSVILISLLLIALPSCASKTVPATTQNKQTEVSTTSTLTPTPTPTANPTQAFTLATSAKEIFGTWLAAGSYYIRFDKDGTFRQAHTLEKLDSQPYSINSYQFEGTKVVITEVKVSGVPTCGKNIGSYEIQSLKSGNIRIVAIQDQCAARARDLAGEYEPVR